MNGERNTMIGRSHFTFIISPLYPSRCRYFSSRYYYYYYSRTDVQSSASFNFMRSFSSLAVSVL